MTGVMGAIFIFIGIATTILVAAITIISTVEWVIKNMRVIRRLERRVTNIECRLHEMDSEEKVHASNNKKRTK